MPDSIPIVIHEIASKPKLRNLGFLSSQEYLGFSSMYLTTIITGSLFILFAFR